MRRSGTQAMIGIAVVGLAAAALLIGLALHGGHSAPAGVQTATSTPTAGEAHPYFPQVSDQELPGGGMSWSLPPANAPSPAVSRAAAERAADRGAQVHGVAGAPVAARLVIQSGRTVWVFLYEPSGGFSISGERGPVRVAYNYEVVDATTGEYGGGASFGSLNDQSATP